MNLQHVGAVFQRIGLAQHRARQLARLAAGHEPGPQPQRHGRAHDEPAGLGAHHLGNAAIGEMGRQIVHHGGEGVGVGEGRREVFEHDPGLRVVRNVDDKFLVGAHGASFLAAAHFR